MMTKKIVAMGIAASSLTVFVGVGLFSVSSHAQNYPIVQILKRNAENYAFDGNHGGANGQDVYIYSENQSNVNQQWYEIDRGNGYYTLQKLDTNYCLDGNNNGENGQNVYLWTCSATNENQHWRKVSMGGDYYRLEKRNAPAYSLDGNNGGANGQSVYLWSSNDANQNQHWAFNYVSDSTSSSDVNCSGTYDLESCIDDMSNRGGGTVVLDSKTYYLTEPVSLQSNVNIQGQGSSTLITWDDSVANTINEPLLVRTSGSVNNVVMQDFSMSCRVDTGREDQQYRTDTRGVYITGDGSQFDTSSLQHSNITMERVEIYQCGGEGIQMKGLDTFTGIDLNFHNNGWGNTDLWHNIYLKRVRNITIKQTSTTSGGFRDSPSGHGMRMSDLDDVYLENLTVEGNADHGLHMDNVSNFRGHNLRLEGNCTIPNGLCRASGCYNDCDYDLDAGKE